ncbi:putative zinc finger protein [Orchesella cincta]|uniref:Putative zinc finger protein n=1 Tax=Orchesella cincta TaxID=48709 RepID=A0A1D2M504_ORCCI|nr:putative zinc finger protein [Orchesella cincta]
MELRFIGPSVHNPMSVRKMEKYQCKKCGKCFSRKGTLVGHNKVHSHKRLHQCTLCDKNYKSKCNLSDHVKTAHSQVTQCSFSSYILSGLKNHVRKVHEGKKSTTKPFDCLICGKTLTTAAGRELHIMAVHTNERPFPCSICGRAFKVKGLMKRHFETHSGLKHYKCTKCTSSFATQSGLNSHDKVMHIKARIHPCSFCDKMFITTTHRNAHLVTHLRINEKLQKCKLCGKSYASLTALKYHIKLHHRKEKGFPFRCLFCERKANTMSVFMGHIQTHLRERFDCEQCPKSFSNACTLTTHLKDHPQIYKSQNEQILYSCRKKQCSFECKKLTEFHKHLQFVHKSQRQFRCELCEKSFTTKQNLDSHTRSHLNEKPYQCSICKIRYGASSSVKHCLDRHHNIRRFKCNVCPRAFSFKGKLRNHYLSIHADPQERRHCCIFCGKRYAMSVCSTVTSKGIHVNDRIFVSNALQSSEKWNNSTNTLKLIINSQIKYKLSTIKTILG